MSEPKKLTKQDETTASHVIDMVAGLVVLGMDLETLSINGQRGIALRGIGGSDTDLQTLIDLGSIFISMINSGKTVEEAVCQLITDGYLVHLTPIADRLIELSDAESDAKFANLEEKT